VNATDPSGRVIKLVKAAFNVGRRAVRNGGDLRRAGIDEVQALADNFSTLADGQLSLDDAIAVFDLATGFGDELKAISKLENLADSATSALGAGKGAVHGSNVHAEFAKRVWALGDTRLHAEVSYKDGKIVPYGTPGSVRVDVVYGDPAAPTALIDLKTGGAALSKSRANALVKKSPNGDKCRVYCVKPNQ